MTGFNERKRFNAAAIAVVLLAAAWTNGATLHASTNGVEMHNFFFTPTNLSIFAGDTVVWTNKGTTTHDSTAGNPVDAAPLWGSALLPAAGTFAFTFVNPGAYPYVCKQHTFTAPAAFRHLEMTGLVSVAAANLPPTVRITSPTNGAVAPSPASLIINIDAVATSGTVTNVDVFLDANFLGSITAAPFNLTFSNLFTGSYSLTAIATDSAGNHATSAPANVTITGQIVGVEMQNFFFTPTNVTIHPGDTVSWTNKASFSHDSTAGNPVAAAPLWASALLSGNQTFSFTFNNSGSYPYVCKQHTFSVPAQFQHPEMTGMVSVTTANFRPSIAFTSPSDGSLLAAPASFSLRATASQQAGSIAGVDFYMGANLLGRSTAAPYLTPISDLPVGRYTFTARATDDHGFVGFASPVTVTVASLSPVQLLQPRLVGNSFGFDITSTAGLHYVVQTTPAADGPWTSIQTNLAASSRISVTDPVNSSSLTNKFYRVLVQP